jgi:hypothetical protein
VNRSFLPGSAGKLACRPRPAGDAGRGRRSRSRARKVRAATYYHDWKDA